MDFGIIYMLMVTEVLMCKYSREKYKRYCHGFILLTFIHIVLQENIFNNEFYSNKSESLDEGEHIKCIYLIIMRLNLHRGCLCFTTSYPLLLEEANDQCRN